MGRARIYKAKTPKKKESVVQGHILDYLRYRPGAYWRQNTGAVRYDYNGKTRFVKFGVKGAADITGIRDGRRIEIEVKREGEVQNDNQKHFQAVIEREGGLYILAYSLEDVQRAGI